MTRSSKSQLKSSSRKAFTLLLQHCSELVVCLDVDLCIIEMNNVAARAHNWRHNDVICKNYMTLCLESNLTNPISFDPALILSGKTVIHHESTFINVRPGGLRTRCVISWTITRLVNDNKEPYGILMLGTDITDAKEAWKKVHNLDSIIKYAPGFIYYWKDKDSIHLGCNNSFAELAGLKSREDVIGKTDFDFPWKEQAASYQKDDQEVIQSGKPKNNIQNLLLAADGKMRTVISNKVPLRDIEGNIIGLLGTTTDITQLKDAEKAILEAKHRAELASQAKSNFLAVMSHELRTPLNAIMGMTRILQKKNTTTKAQQECINLIRNASSNLLMLINDILDFAELEAGKFEIVHENFNLHTLTHKIIDHARARLHNNQIKLFLDYSETAPHSILLDPYRVEQVLTNLISNAIKFTNQGEIHMFVTCKQQIEDVATLQITVTDTGIGIPSDKLNRIFEYFTQIESRYSRRFDGTGLGLSISKRLVESMGGSIGVYSTLGEGSRFWVELDAKVSPSIPLEPEPINFNLPNPRILLVEDNLLNQKVAKSMLEDLGCHLEIASTGKQALDLFNDTDYDLVFMDISLPDTDGLAVTQRIRQCKSKKANTPIIALTAHALHQDKENCFNAGLDEVLTKPVMPDKLKDTLKQWVGKTSKRLSRTTFV